MKFIVTFVRQSKHSRRRMGKAQTDTINTESGTYALSDPDYNPYYGMEKPVEIEEMFEETNSTPAMTVKVVDIREVK